METDAGLDEPSPPALRITDLSDAEGYLDAALNALNATSSTITSDTAAEVSLYSPLRFARAARNRVGSVTSSVVQFSQDRLEGAKSVLDTIDERTSDGSYSGILPVDWALRGVASFARPVQFALDVTKGWAHVFQSECVIDIPYPDHSNKQDTDNNRECPHRAPA